MNTRIKPNLIIPAIVRPVGQKRPLEQVLEFVDQGKFEAAKALLCNDDKHVRGSFQIPLGLALSEMLKQGKNKEIIDLVLSVKNGDKKLWLTEHNKNQFEGAIINIRTKSPLEAAEVIKKIMNANLRFKISAQVIINITTELMNDKTIPPDKRLELFEELVRRSFNEGYVSKSIDYLENSLDILENPIEFFETEKQVPSLGLIHKSMLTAKDLSRRFH